MCIDLKEMYLCKNPISMYGDFQITTRQYNEIVDKEKEYAFFGNSKYISKFNDIQRIYVPCGKCFTCLSKRGKSWTLRLTTEYLKWNNNCVLTLTYDDAHLPENGLLNYRDVQLFLKRLRKRLGSNHKIRFACVCEYGQGEKSTIRPHYHIIIFNWLPPDINILKPYKITQKKSKLYKSKICDELWSNGFVDVGLVDHKTSRYVCQYCVKKAKESKNIRYLEKIKQKREKLVTSVGTGLEYFMQNMKSIFDQKYCVLGNYKYPIPKYFKNKLKQLFPELFEKYKEECKQLLINFELTPEVQKRFEAIEEAYKRKYLKYHT
ncbi:MAG: hypothetical protein IJY61_04290 [Candidatus Gastranaerophilales bacterium]|nr:hypothetical protein [Candidatus Gastranaerophilales bacterium]